MKTLIIIPARAGSKGLPDKNSKLLVNKPLISHTIDFAIEIKSPEDIVCLTTNDEKVIKIAGNYKNIEILRRSEDLSSDIASMNDVLVNALEHFQELNIHFEQVLLLQPTTPFRSKEDYKAIVNLLDKETEMVVSAKESKANPYFNLFEIKASGYIEKCKIGNFTRRQDTPRVYQYNGSMYLLKTKALLKSGLHGIKNTKIFVMPDIRSIDIDDSNDWIFAEFNFDLFWKK